MAFPLQESMPPQLGSSSDMPILVPPFDYSDSQYSPQQPPSADLSKALQGLSFGVGVVAGVDTTAAATATTVEPAGPIAEAPLATADSDREMTAWRELWDFSKPSAEHTTNTGDFESSLAPALDRGFSNSVASEVDSIPELASDYSTSPDQSPASLYETCSTPPQECVNAVCDVPLLAPRPLPCIPPALFQFDFLPNEKDSDASRLPSSSSQFPRSREYTTRKRRRSPSPLPPPIMVARPRPMPHVARPVYNNALHVAPVYQPYPPPHEAKRRRQQLPMPAVEPAAYYPHIRHVEAPFAQAPHAPHAERYIMPSAGSDYRTTIGWV